MSVQTARTGAFAYLKYGWESSFKGGASTKDKVFGRGQRITSLTRRENPELIPELGDRIYYSSAFKQFEGTISLEWILSNPWFFKGILGSVTTSGTGPYTHTYSVTKLPQSMSLEVGIQASGGNVVRTLDGAIFTSATITSAVGELVRVRADLLYAKETVGTNLGSALVDTFPPLVFHHATLEVPSGNTIGEVQSFDLTINNNGLLIYGLGDRYAVSGMWQALDVAGTISVTLKDATFLNYLASEIPSAKLKIYLSSSNSIEINMANVVFGEHSVTIEPNALIVESLPIQVRSIQSVVATNNTPIHP
ncbi:MAG: phage tail tube protein [Desulfurococcaceae archaeon]